MRRNTLKIKYSINIKKGYGVMIGRRFGINAAPMFLSIAQNGRLPYSFTRYCTPEQLAGAPGAAEPITG